MSLNLREHKKATLFFLVTDLVLLLCYASTRRIHLQTKVVFSYYSNSQLHLSDTCGDDLSKLHIFILDSRIPAL